jgi:hypothetical protein
MTVRLACALVILQAAFLALGGVFVVTVALLLGGDSSIAFAGSEFHGASAVALGLCDLAVAGLLTWFAIAAGRLLGWSRTALLASQGVLVALFVAAGARDLSDLFAVLVCVAVAGLLLTPSARTALTNRSAPPFGEATSHSPEG